MATGKGIYDPDSPYWKDPSKRQIDDALLGEGFTPGESIGAGEYANIRNRVGGQLGRDAATEARYQELLREQAAARNAASARRSARSSKLQSQLTGAYDKSTADIDQAYASLEALLRGQANPFADYQAQQAQVSGGLAELLGSQGVSNLPVQQLGAALQAQNTGQSTAFQNLANVMRDLYGASQQGSLADVGRMRTQSREAAANNRKEILRMLIQALR
jgi:hypothetical protein